jgi:hypothetical protein
MRQIEQSLPRWLWTAAICNVLSGNQAAHCTAKAMTENAIAKQPEASAKSPVEIHFRCNRECSSSIEYVRFRYGGSTCGEN